VRSLNVIAAALVAWCAAQASHAQVVATIKPVHSLVAQVMEGQGAPALLIEDAADPHSYALRPSDAKALSSAKLVVMIGRDFETFLARPLASIGAQAKVLELARLGDMSLPGGDQHLWLDPENAERAVLAIGRALTEIDPARGYEYTRNAARAKERIAALDRELRETLASVRDKPFVVRHDAFRGFAQRYRLNLVGAQVAGAEHAPGARHAAELSQKARAAGARCVARLDDLGTQIPPGPELYFVLMRGVARSLIGCLNAPG
jgi:zinc transport system substrate-binding protein